MTEALGTIYAPEMAVYSAEDGLEPAGPYTPHVGPVEYIRADIARTDAEQAVAVAYQRAASRFPDGKTPWPPHAIRDAILALAPADALAEVQALKAAHEATCAKLNGYITYASEQHERAEAAEAEVARLREALRDLIDHTHNCEKELTEKLHHADFCGESLPLTNARAALGDAG